MRKLIITTLFLVNALLPALANENWQASSTEKQFDKTSTAVTKASSGLIDGSSNNSTSSQKAPALQRLVQGVEQDSNHEFWIYEAWIEYKQDPDFDGFYSTFSVEFDADTIFAHAEVYARLYLARGDIYQEYYTTSIFSISGDNSLDSLEVTSELVQGFPSDDYDMLIELYDADSGFLVATFDANNDADLTLLTLESSDFESVETTIVISSESGGSLGLTSLLLMLAYVGIRISRRLEK